MTAQTDYPVIVNRGLIVAASVTSLSTPATVLTTNHMGRQLLISNTLDTDTTLTLDGVPWIDLPAQQGGGFNGVNVVIPAGKVIGVLPISATPTSGFLSLSNN